MPDESARKSIISWHCDQWDSETRKPETDPECVEFLNGQDREDTDLHVRMWALHNLVPPLIC